MYSLLLIYEFWWVLDCRTLFFFFLCFICLCRFIYLFIGVGVVLFVISCVGCIGATTRNGCCLTCVSLVLLTILFNCNYRDFDFHHPSVSHGNDNIILISRTAVFHHFNKSSAIYSKSDCRSESQLVWLVDLCNKVHWKLWIHMMNAAAHAILFGCIFPDKF